MVANAVESCRPLIDGAGHILTVNLPAEPIIVYADPTRLTQVLLNLLSNAIKYTEPGGRIWLTAARDQNEVVFRVKDTGIGISADKLPRVFEMLTHAGPHPGRDANRTGHRAVTGRDAGEAPRRPRRSP